MNEKRGRNRKGLSKIVITLMVILLSLVAIAIVWVVVRNIIEGGTKEAAVSLKCLNTNVKVIKANCSDGQTNKFCDVTLMRSGSGSSVIGGVKLVFKNETADKISGVIDVAGNIETLIGKKETGIDTGIANSDGVDRVDVAVYFKDESGEQQVCQQINSFKF